MTNKTPSGAEEHHENTEPESTKTTKLCFFFFPEGCDIGFFVSNSKGSGK